MELNVFVGAHRTAAQHIRSLAQTNAEMLTDQGIVFADPEPAQEALNIATKAVEEGKDRGEIRQAFLDVLSGGRDAKRIILMDADMAGTLTRPTGGSLIYPRIRFAARRLRAAMYNQRFRVFLAIRNPATFMPSCYSEALVNAHNVSLAEYVKETNLHALRWSDCIDRLNEALLNKELKLYHGRVFVWRYEDYEFYWRQIFYALTGVLNPQDIEGSSAKVNQGLSPYGSQLMHKYLTNHKPDKPGQFRAIGAEFLEKFPSGGDDTPVDAMPPELINELTDSYEDDWYFIERQDNVTTIQPRRIYK